VGILFAWIKKQVVRTWAGLIWLVIRSSGESSKHGNKSSSSMRARQDNIQVNVRKQVPEAQIHWAFGLCPSPAIINK
jgi:hypothetical protein